MATLLISTRLQHGLEAVRHALLFLVLLGCALVATGASATSLYTGVVASDVPSASFGQSSITRAVGAAPDGTIYVGFFTSDLKQVRVARSSDHGATFAPSVLVGTAAASSTFYTASLNVSSTGSVFVAYEAGGNVFLARSSNAGTTFTNFSGLGPLSAPLAGIQVQTQGNYVYVGYVVSGGVAVAASSDGGVSFATPVKVIITCSYFGLLVDQSNGDVIVGAEMATLHVRVSHDHGATFDAAQNPSGQTNFSNWTISSDESGRYLWVGGTDIGSGDPVHQIDLSNGASTVRTAFLSTTTAGSRSMYAAGCGDVVDSVAGSWAASHNFGTTLGSTYPVNGSNQTTSINPLTGDVLVTYLNGDIKLDVYQDELFPCSPHLTVTVSDGHDFARYGQMLNYLVTVSNNGYAAAENIVASLSSPGSGLDLANAQWGCVGSDNTARCSSSNGTGAALGTVTLPPRTSMTWVVGVPVLASMTDGTIELDANATDANMASDVDTLVIFRSDFDVTHADGTRASN